MIATKIEPKLAAEPLTKEVVSELIHAGGPCITLLLPPYRPGESGESPAAILKADLQEAAKKLAARKIAEPLIRELLEPLERLSQAEESLAGAASARVIFRSHEVFRKFKMPIAPSPARACIVGDCFSIRPILSSAALAPAVYVLEVTKKAVRLLACGFTAVTPAQLPKGTPQTLDEALGFDAPDHDLINRSSAGPSTGAMPGVQFGTGSGRETQHAHLRDFYHAVDRGVCELLRSTQAPLVLAGVDEDVAIYRSISAYPNLLEQGIHGSPGAPVSPAQILQHAYDIALFTFQKRVANEMAEAKERLAPGRFSADLDGIVRAAVEGRVSHLYLDESGRRMGTFAAKVFGGHANWHDEELLNVAALETLLRGGAVYSLPTHCMPAGAVAAAAFRY
ncbi:MAG: hypothetical protein WBE37_27380 [Bryobacteraceae bacterium]